MGEPKLDEYESVGVGVGGDHIITIGRKKPGRPRVEIRSSPAGGENPKPLAASLPVADR